MTGHVTLCWSTYFLGDISARNRRFLAEKSPRNHCSVNRADFSPISRREIADFSPRNHCLQCEVVCDEHGAKVNSCAVVYERDEEFGPVEVVETSITTEGANAGCLPSEKIEESQLKHLSQTQRRELLEILDRKT